MGESERVDDENGFHSKMDREALDEFEEIFQKIFDRRDERCPLSFMNIHLKIYNYCVNFQTFKSRKQFEMYRSRRRSKLYERIKEFLERHVIKLENEGKDLSDEEIIQYYVERWDDYQSSVKFLNDTCMYFKNCWILPEIKAGRKHITEIDQLAFQIWKKGNMDKRAIKAFLKLIETERCFGTINSRVQVICSLTEYYVKLEYKLTKNGFGSKESNLSVYEEVFEKPLFEETRRFYNRQSAEMIIRNSIVDYLTKVEKCLQEEQKRVQTYLPKSNLDPLLKICCEVLIQSWSEILSMELKNLLTEKKHDELALIYKITSRIPDVIGALYVAIKEDACECGSSAIEKCGIEASDNPKLFVDTILQVRQEYLMMISKIFNDDSRCVKALDKACENFTNHNYVTKLPNSSSAKAAELVARHCNSLLKKSVTNLDAAELDESLTQVGVIFKYIEDKDVFQNIYSKLLAKRLVSQLPTNNDAEESMICQIKQICGGQYAFKVQRMFKDVTVNRHLNHSFRFHLIETKKSLDLDFGVQVLTSGSWPFQQSIRLALPVELEKSIHEFMTFYNIYYYGRKLSWLYQLCNGELVVNCFEKRYTLQVSVFQMAVLLLFNSADSYSLQQIEEITQINDQYVIQLIQLLLKSKLLICEDDENNLGPNTVIKIFLNYNNKKQRVNLNVPLKIEYINEHENAQKFIMLERRILIQAAIVRIMKTRQELQHQQLLSEVLTQLSSLFKPKILTIKKCIDILIEKDYLERIIDETNIYRYVA